MLPTVWFRNTWSWDSGAPKPVLASTGESSVGIEHPFLGELELIAGPGRRDRADGPVLRERDERGPAFRRAVDHAVPEGRDQRPRAHRRGHGRPDQRGTKCALWYRLAVEPGATAELRLRLRPKGSAPAGTDALDASFDQVVSLRRAEADEFYTELSPGSASAGEVVVMRQAFAGLLWSKQFYYYEVSRWLDGDPTQPPPPAARRTARNAQWDNFDAFDIMSMPDKWEYPWFAAWDLAFHCVALAHLDPAFAKYQLILVCREWFQHPDGALPAYQWDFSDVNPPVHAWAALEVFAIDGGRDLDFLARVFDKLLINFTWWINREDAGGSNVFQGGFLGLDNIGPIDHSGLPAGDTLDQSDATGWMAFYAIGMATIATVLYRSSSRPGTDLAVKFLEHFAAIATAIDRQGMWDDSIGLYFDELLLPDGTAIPIQTRSMVGVIPALAAAIVDQRFLDQSLRLGKQFADYLQRHGLNGQAKLAEQGMLRGQPGDQQMILSVASLDHLEKVCSRLFDTAEFLSPYGLRASRRLPPRPPVRTQRGGPAGHGRLRARRIHHLAVRRKLQLAGTAVVSAQLPAHQFPRAVRRFYGDELTLEYPTGSGHRVSLNIIAADLEDRLISIFLVGADGRGPVLRVGRPDAA